MENKIKIKLSDLEFELTGYVLKAEVEKLAFKKLAEIFDNAIKYMEGKVNGQSERISIIDNNGYKEAIRDVKTFKYMLEKKQ